MSFKSVSFEEGKTLHISLTGRFDITAHGDFIQTYKDKLGLVSKIVVDLAAVDYIDSSALGMLLILREKAGGEKADISLLNCSPDVRRSIEHVHFDKMFHLG
ncbi:MAG: STAS domain-containing protein [Deltaproteobacteria bacterium]|nr:STAS domain-containing protein [Deltaproteobacteria bacterium]